MKISPIKFRTKVNDIKPLVVGIIALRITNKVYSKAYLLKNFVPEYSTTHPSDVTHDKGGCGSHMIGGPL